MPPTLGQGGNQAVEDAVVLAHHAHDLTARTAARLPRTTAIARRAVRAARVIMAAGPAAVAVRDRAIAVLSKAAPAHLLRGFDDIAGRRPPYAAQDTVER
jgi:2-polyprenyl-6-methoxyphenol hydroxylase-like FAD-dependent oxidoreductase